MTLLVQARGLMTFQILILTGRASEPLDADENDSLKGFGEGGMGGGGNGGGDGGGGEGGGDGGLMKRAPQSEQSVPILHIGATPCVS